jgi:hypothetical protein
VGQAAAVARRLAGAVVVGVATHFQPKRSRDEHRSIPPTWPVDDDGASDEAGGEP